MWQTTETDNYVSITDRIAARRRAERLAQKQEEERLEAEMSPLMRAFLDGKEASLEASKARLEADLECI